MLALTFPSLIQRSTEKDSIEVGMTHQPLETKEMQHTSAKRVKLRRPTYEAGSLYTSPQRRVRGRYVRMD